GSGITIDTLTGSGAVNVISGSHAIAAPLTLAKSTVFTVSPAGSTLSASNLQSSALGITKAGLGRLAVNNVRAGSLTVSAGTASIIAGRSTAGTSNVMNLSVAAGATLDLADQDLVIDWTGASPLATVQSL